MNVALIFGGVALTFLAYGVSRRLTQRFHSPLTAPVLFGTATIVAVLMLSGHTLADYQPARNAITYLLGPATVALAVPVYRQRALLLQHARPALLGILIGSLATAATAVGLAVLLGLTDEVVRSVGMKSVTAPVAIEISRILNGNAALTAAFVIATGTTGAVLGPWLMSRLGIVEPFARGLSLGAVSHGQGTAQAVAEGPIQGAVAGIAMALVAMAASFVGPLWHYFAP